MRVFRLLTIALCGVACGLAWNTFSGRGFVLTHNVLVKAGDEVIDLAQTRQRQDKGALLLDARPKPFYVMGHVPGAVSLPQEQFDQVFPSLEAQLRSRLDTIVYCSGFGCEASHMVARRLKDRGIPAAIFGDGWPAWQDAGLPQSTGEAP